MASHDAINDSEQTRSLRAPSSEPILTQRDVVGAQNRSPSRKRPRLDSGSRTARSMSADQPLSSLDKAAGEEGDDLAMEVDSETRTPELDDSLLVANAVTPSKVTINVREPQKEGALPSANGRRDSSSSQNTSKGANGMNGHANTTGDSTSASTSPTSASSPIIEVADAQSDESPTVVTEIRLEDEVSINERIEMLFYNFPYATEGAFGEAAELIAEEQNRSRYKNSMPVDSANYCSAQP